MKSKRSKPSAHYPTAAQFEAHPQAKAIRDVCLEALATIHHLQHGGGDKLAGAATLERCNGRLLELGCWANMCISMGSHTYNDPLAMARYCAGQIIRQLGKRVVSAQDIAPIIQEHAQYQAQGITAMVMPGRDLPAPVRAFIVTDWVAADMYRFLDASPPD